MKTFCLSLLLPGLFFCSTNGLAHQSSVKVLRGKVLTKTNEPVSGATLSILGVHSAMTNSDGEYTLDLQKCSSCTIGETLQISVNSDYGSGDFTYTIRKDHNDLTRFDIALERNKVLIVSGRVKDRQTGRFLPGIKVIATLPDEEIPVNSNENGFFKITINRYGIDKTQAITLAFRDVAKGRYNDLEKIFYINQYGPLNIELEESADAGEVWEFKINRFEQTDLFIKQGNRVMIEASGAIDLGYFTGSSGPGGLPGNQGPGGLSMNILGYNIFKEWNHACLVFRVGETDDWKFYDLNTKNTFTAQYSGYLQFKINDTKLTDNKGEYVVKARVWK